MVAVYIMKTYCVHLKLAPIKISILLKEESYFNCLTNSEYEQVARGPPQRKIKEFIQNVCMLMMVFADLRSYFIYMGVGYLNSTSSCIYNLFAFLRKMIFYLNSMFVLFCFFVIHFVCLNWFLFAFWNKAMTKTQILTLISNAGLLTVITYVC